MFRKARQKAKEELTVQLSEFQVKRQVGLGTLYGPEDDVILRCHVDKVQVRHWHAGEVPRSLKTAGYPGEGLKRV